MLDLYSREVWAHISSLFNSRVSVPGCRPPDLRLQLAWRLEHSGSAAALPAPAEPP